MSLYEVVCFNISEINIHHTAKDQVIHFYECTGIDNWDSPKLILVQITSMELFESMFINEVHQV